MSYVRLPTIVLQQLAERGDAAAAKVLKQRR
jgi:hypothetical protein